MQKYTELIGYLGSFVVMASFLLKDIKKLRIVNIIGCTIFICYAVLKDFSIPIILTNSVIVLINGYYLAKS